MDGWMDGWMDGCMYEWMDECELACLHALHACRKVSLYVCMSARMHA